jgi:glyoxylase-like metal-dependent hydrolase (beta-lactamase superfamily II)
MTILTRDRSTRVLMWSVILGASLAAALVLWTGRGVAARAAAPASAPGVPYANMPSIAPIGVRMDKYADVPEAAKGPAVDPAKGYRTQKLGDGLYMVTDGSYQSMFMTYEDGVVVVDAPPQYASLIPRAIAEVTDKPITHVVYSHYHTDHIGGATALAARPIIIAHAETNRALARARDPNRPLATVTFDQQYRLTVGSQVLELSYHGNAHAPGNIFISAPRQRTLMVVDVVFPGWMPWRRFAVAQDVNTYFAQVREISQVDFDTLVGGHVGRTGTRADVALQLAFMDDLKSAAAAALASTKLGEGMVASDRLHNAWAVFDSYIDRVALSCVNQLTPKWSTTLAAFDVYVWDQCFAMEQALRIE